MHEPRDPPLKVVNFVCFFFLSSFSFLFSSCDFFDICFQVFFSPKIGTQEVRRKRKRNPIRLGNWTKKKVLKKWFILLLPLFRFLSLSFLPDGKKKGIGLGRRMGTFGLGSSLRKEKSRKQRLLSPLCSQIMLASLWRNMLAAKKIKKEFEKIQEKRLPKMLAMISYCTVKYSRRKKALQIDILNSFFSFPLSFFFKATTTFHFRNSFKISLQKRPLSSPPLPLRE